MDPADFAAHFERIRKWKEAQVHAIQEAAEGGGGRAAGGFLARLGKKIRENLQIHINDFRIEYIDRRTPEVALLLSVLSVVLCLRCCCCALISPCCCDGGCVV